MEIASRFYLKNSYLLYEYQYKLSVDRNQKNSACLLSLVLRVVVKRVRR